MKRIVALLLSVIIILSMVTSTLAAQKISNPDTRGGVDGIDYDPDIGVHNSYAWCSEVFKQADSDYLWVGTNRDLGAMLFGNVTSGLSLSTFGIPDASVDSAGRIYRQRVSDNDAKWELVYKNTAINGYRRMIVFKDDLYVLAGLSNRRSLTADYSVVLRFSKDFKSGDEPEIVFWENVVGTTTEYFRAATVLDGKLYIGTFDSKVWVTDGTGLQNLTPNAGPKDTGWSLALTLNPSEYGVRTNGAIWDLLAFNGSVYAFVAHVGDAYQPVDGFGVYKITPEGGRYALKQIVGDTSARYPYGFGVGKNILGFSKNMTASGFIYDDHVYVTTFANGPLFLGAMAQGNYTNAFNNLFCPAQIYRFDKDDKWEVVVGDEYGKYVAVDHSGAQLPRVSDPSQRAGFFLQDYNFDNVSFNQYVWWMTEHEGKLYASTWDMSVFKQYYSFLCLLVFNDITDGAVFTLLNHIMAMEEQIQALLNNYESVDIQALAEDIGAYLQIVGDALSAGIEIDVNDIIAGFVGIITQYFPMAETGELVDAVNAFVEAVCAIDLDPCEVITKTLAFISATALFFIDTSNPAGFDLYVSENGRDFTPVTVDGFGDPCNYGGRVLVSSEHGLYVTTANPFNGGQVWRLSPMEPGIHPNGPSKITLTDNDEATITVLVVDAPQGSSLTLNYGSDLVSVRLVKRQSGKSVADYAWDNQVKCVPGTSLRYYDVTETETLHDTVMYDAIITPIKTGSQNLTLNFRMGGVTESFTVAVEVSLRQQCDAGFLQERAAAIKRNGLSTDNLRLIGKTLTLVIDGREFVLSTNANNRNIDGQIYLCDNYYLVFDIKGNGSNIKEFKIIQK